MNLKLSNLKKPSNAKWKLIADVMLYTLPLYQGAIMTSPLSDNFKMWLGFFLTMTTVTLKAITKFTSNENTN